MISGIPLRRVILRTIPPASEERAITMLILYSSINFLSIAGNFVKSRSLVINTLPDAVEIKGTCTTFGGRFGDTTAPFRSIEQKTTCSTISVWDKVRNVGKTDDALSTSLAPQYPRYNIRRCS